MSGYAETRTTLEGYRRQIEALHAEMRKLQAAIEPQVVADYEFEGPDGPVKLSELFGDKTDLFVIHNMGTSCSYCTMWADGFNGVYDHLADRAAFVVSSPNPPIQQAQFAKSRGWRFPMVSHGGGAFARDMGYHRPGADAGGDMMGGWYPGVSAFKKTADGVVRVSDAELGPGDDFCSVWHLFDLLPEGAAGWRPQFRYASA
jgi:predicted dithiol-disulfide oxidoreductase (DUF899 family)